MTDDITTAAEIIESLASRPAPVVADRCLLCDQWVALRPGSDPDDPTEHAPGCPWRRASEFLAPTPEVQW